MNKYLKAISYNFIFFVISSIAYLVFTPLALKVMGEEFYGLWTVLFTIGQFSNLGMLGIGSIVNKFCSEAGNKEPIQINRILSSAMVIVTVMSALVSLIIIAFLSPLAEAIKPSAVYLSQLKVSILIYALSIWPHYLIRVFTGFFHSRLENKLVGILDFFLGLLPIIGGVVISYLIKNLIVLSLWNLLVTLAVLVIFLIEVKKRVDLRFTPTKATVQKMSSFSGYMFIQNFAISLFQHVDRILVGIVLGPIAVGIYSVASSMALRLSLIVGNITGVLTPFASLKDSLGEEARVEYIFRKVSKYVSLLIALLSGILIIWMKEVLSVWISPDYAAANALTFNLMVLAYSYSCLFRPAHSTLTGLGKVKFTSLAYLISSIILLIAVFFLSKAFGLPGASAANVLIASLWVMNLFLYRTFEKKHVWLRFFTDLSFGLIVPLTSLIVYLLSDSNLMKFAYSSVLILIIFAVLARDKDFTEQAKRVIAARFAKNEAA